MQSTNKEYVMSISRVLTISLILVGVALPYSAIAMTPDKKGLAIAVEDDKRDNGFLDYKADAIMILKNRQGDESTRYLRFKTLEVQGDGDKNLTVFDKPRDIKKSKLVKSRVRKPKRDSNTS